MKRGRNDRIDHLYPLRPFAVLAHFAAAFGRLLVVAVTYHPLYTFGYSGRQPEELLALAEQLDAIVADIRFSPRSRIPQWSGGRLARLLGDRYRHLPALGNRNYKGGPIELVDPETSIAQVADLLAHQPVILLCVCAEVERCHRRLAAEAIAGRYGVVGTHL